MMPHDYGDALGRAMMESGRDDRIAALERQMRDAKAMIAAMAERLARLEAAAK